MSPLDLTFYTIAITVLLYYVHLLSTTFHRYPKPLPPGPTPWPVIGNLLQMGEIPHRGLAKLAKKYGPLMHLRLGSIQAVVAGSASVAAQFLKVHDANFSERPPNAGAEHIAYNYEDLVFAPYGPRWRLLRKICVVHLFSPKALDDCTHHRQEEVKVLIKTLLESNNEKPVRLGQLLSICTTNALFRVMLGRRVFGGETDLNEGEFTELVEEAMVLAGVFDFGDFIPALKWLDIQGVVSKMKKFNRRFDEYISVIIEERKASIAKGLRDPHAGDFLDTLLTWNDSCVDENEKLTDIQIKALLLNLFVAGSDTSSITIEWAITELIRHPKILAKVREELDSVVGPNRPVNDSDLPKLTYFQAVIKEVFRLYPATPLSIPRMSANPCEINDYYIPKNTTLIVNCWAIARDPDVWADPLKFKPERFLPGGERPNANVKGANFEVIPFGAGRRICVGMSLGIRMVQLLTAILAHAFDWELPQGLTPEKLNMDEAPGINLQRKEPLMVHPKPRLAAHLYV